LVIVGVFAYFACVLLALALWLMPAWRQALWQAITRALSLSRRKLGAAGSAARAAAEATRTGGAQASSAGLGWLGEAVARVREQILWVSLALATLVIVPLAALGLRHWLAFDGFDHTVSRDTNPQVAALLHGEQLVPPAPLPPELFLTREVEQARPMTASANRQWELLDPEFRQRLLGVFKIMRELHGLEMVLIEGYRSPQRQNELASMGAQVTHAQGGESWHQYGLAADNAFLFDGKIVISEADPRAARGYALYGAVAQSFGLVWGGSWRSIKDLGHVELRRAGVMKRP
jgi:peptidoglycan LD-endopeptidase CwlK